MFTNIQYATFADDYGEYPDFIRSQISMKTRGVVEESLKGITRGGGEGQWKKEKNKTVWIILLIRMVVFLSYHES